MTNSNNTVDETKKALTENGQTEVKEAKNENESTKANGAEKADEKKADAKEAESSKAQKTSKTEEKRIMTESEAREYINGLKFKHIDIPELYETMQVPSCSRYEFRMAAYIVLWARKNDIKYDFDKKGNIYLTKGELEEGEFYPCVTAHMDTVQDKAKPYALAGAELPLRTRRVKNDTTGEVRHEIYIDGQGIGADDKLGVYISLQLVKKFDKIKAAFFVEEETGMQGSKELDASFFDDVAYVIGWDSPDLHRAAWKCSGTRLFSHDFYVNHLAPIVKRWGFTDRCFRSEPFTDVINIREKTGVMCMNFGNGGYQAHSSTEYLVIEHVDHATGMGADIIRTIGNNTQFKSAKKTYTYTPGTTRPEDPERDDDTKLGKLFNEYTYSSSYTPGGTTAGNGTTTPSSTYNRSDGNVGGDAVNNGIDEESVKYIVTTYDEYIAQLKESTEKKASVIEDLIKDKFREAGVDFSTFGINIKEEFAEIFSKDISF